MHRRHASSIFLCAIISAACGGRIAQGDNVDSRNDSPTVTSTQPTPSAPCGSETCGANEECCVGGSPNGNEDDPTAPLESCVVGGTCNSGLLIDCSGANSYGANTADDVCCVTINPTTSYATAGAATTCGGNGLPAVQLCETDADCPQSSQCFIAAMGPNGEGETIQICSGVR